MSQQDELAELIGRAAERLGIDPSQYAAHLCNLSREEALAEVKRRIKPEGDELPNSRQLFYGEIDGRLVFVPEERARTLRALNDARGRSSTWSEYKEALRAISQEVFESEWGRDAADEEDRFGEDDSFESYREAREADGDWPEWLAQLMLEWVPQPIQDRFGDVGISMVSGPALFFDPQDEEALVAEFQRHGFSCLRSQVLISELQGRW